MNTSRESRNVVDNINICACSKKYLVKDNFQMSIQKVLKMFLRCILVKS